MEEGLQKPRSDQESLTAASTSEAAYEQWRANPRTVDSAWDAFFRRICGALEATKRKSSQVALEEESPVSVINQHLVLQHVIRSYQVRGHLVADLDPLGIPPHPLAVARASPSCVEDECASADGGGVAGGGGAGARRRGMPPERLLRHLAAKGLRDLRQRFRLPDATFVGGAHERWLPLGEILRRLDDAYCRHIGVEYMYITSHDKLQWIRQHFESPGARQLSREVRRCTLFRLARASAFEDFLASQWSGERRFGLEGCEALVPAVQQIIDRASQAGVEMVVVGAPHRGRLNLLANVCEKPMRQLMLHFGAAAEPTAAGTGDLKYHLGTVVQRYCALSGRFVTVCLMATPSHLEAADPVVQGRARAEQFLRRDASGDKVMSILLHGDAAFCGQGVVYETFHLSHLPSYTTHGTVHIVINNQVGYTTDPRFSRSSPYCTDVARVVNAPILHVNADHPDDVVHCCDVATAYRMRYHGDVVIDLVGYRRNGHNEADEPMFTQPLMYKTIRQHERVLPLYARLLVEEGVVTAEELQRTCSDYLRLCREEHAASLRETSFSWSEWLDSPWKGFFSPSPEAQLRARPTAVTAEALSLVAARVAAPPPPALRFDLHPGVEQLLRARRALLAGAQADWPLAEALAVGCLLREGVHVRLSGQDVERGVFSQRHHVLHDQSQDKVTYVPLQHLFPGEQAPYSVCNSSLSEYAVLGFEAGYSMASPHWLVMWEAQFGDFCNTAQCIIDQFLASGESKWTRQCGLVVLCPHGLEGMGPEHSSAPVQRFLQLAADDPDELPDLDDPLTPMRQLRATNWIVANCSTPANLFHVLRRQLALPFRKPLVLLTPKGGVMRRPECASPFAHFTGDSEFQRVIPDDGPARDRPEEVRRHILCSGKIYYEFLSVDRARREARRERGVEAQLALTRVEQLCPFPYDALRREVQRFPRAELCWGQEEHKNHGPWTYVLQRLGTLLAHAGVDRLTYVGRAASPAPAAGSRAVHRREQARLLEEATALRPPAQSQ